MAGKNLGSPPPWRWSLLVEAPHRLSFFLAGVVMVLAAAWWCIEMLTRSGYGTSIASAVPPTFIHAVVMTYGFMPLFFCGFLFTAGPRWLQMPEVDARVILPGVCAFSAGWLLWLCGSHWHALMSGLGAILSTGAWGVLTFRFVSLVRRSRVADRLHASLIASACVIGVVGMASAAAGVLTGQLSWLRASAWLGLWWFFVPVYVTVAHRMVPFFTAAAVPLLDAWRPNWLLWTLLGAVASQGGWFVLDACGVGGAPVLLVRALVSGLSCAMVVGLAIRWGLVQSLKIRLLAMLHLGFVWLGLSLGLDALASLQAWFGAAGQPLASLHALTMGFLGSVLIAMATRVSCGHGGRALAADDLAWAIFLALQLAVVLRLLAIWLPVGGPWWLSAAATVWLAALAAWAVRYGRWFGRPRLDGRPG